MTTVQDFSNEFDLLYNNLMSDRAPEINMYEKSMLLTLAQEQIVKEIYNDKFEGDEEKRRSIDVLIEQANIRPDKEHHARLHGDRYFHTHFVLPKNLWYIVHETARYCDRYACKNEDYVPVRPETYDEALHDVQNPFRGPALNRVLRVDYGESKDGGRLVELISKYNVDRYAIRYIREPSPIILVDLKTDEYGGEGLTIRAKESLEWLLDKYGDIDINGAPCELGPNIHNDIVARAVALATNVYKGQ